MTAAGSDGQQEREAQRCGAIIKTGFEFPRTEHVCTMELGHEGKHFCIDCYGMWS